MDAYKALINDLNRYIRKHNTNKLIKGLVYSIGLSVILFLLVLTLEYFGAFSSKARMVLFFSFLAILLLIQVKYLIIPLAYLLNIKKGLNHKEAAKIIGEHFPSVNDKLVNVLELEELSQKESIEIRHLIQAGISQKAEEIKPIPFLSSINFSENLKYAKYALIPLAIMLGIWLIKPQFVKDPAKRLISYNQEFEPTAPFQLSFDKSINILEGEDLEFTINVIEGGIKPSDISINFVGYKEVVPSSGAWSYKKTFSNLRKDFSFSVEADGFNFGEVEVKVLPQPNITGFIMELTYPAYTGKKSEIIDGSGDAIVPQGTRVNWRIKTNHTDSLSLIGVPKPTIIANDQLFELTWLANQTINYGISRQNEHVSVIDSNLYTIQIIKDAHPKIEADLRANGITQDQYFLVGEIADDYGFKDLKLFYRKKDQNIWNIKPIQIEKHLSNQTFYISISDEDLGLTLGDSITYYFEVRDNDAPNGFKATKTEIEGLRIKTEKELLEDRNKGLENSTNQLEELLKLNQEISSEIEKLNKELLSKKQTDLNDRKQLEQLIKKKQELNKKLEQLSQQNKQTEKLQEKLNGENENITEQQKQLNELMENSMDPEMEKVMDEIQQLMQNMDQDQLLEKLKELNQLSENQKQELDRSLELMKKFAHDLKLKQLASELDKLAKQQENLAKEDNANKELNEQKEINKTFDELKKDLNDLNKEAKDLNKQMDLSKEEKKANEIREDLNKIEQDLKEQGSSPENKNSKQKKNTNQKQQKAKEEMEQLSQQIESSMASSEAQQQQENIEDLKQILENLVDLSEDQEEIYSGFASLSTSDPIYGKLTVEQANSIENFKIIEDSLNALAKRVIQIEAVVRKEINTINREMANSISELGERVTSRARMHQRYSLTAINNLALLLSEVLEQLEKQQAQANPGMANCNKPSQGNSSKPSLQKMRKAQEQFAKQMEQMMKKGQGEQKGEKEGQGKNQGGNNSKELIEMAAKQAQLRKQLRELAKELNKDGSGSGNKLNELAKELEEVEKDLYYNQVNPETLLRQREIITKLLEEEKAERTQELDNKREGQKAEEYLKENPEYQKYLEQRKLNVEQLQSLPLELREYYLEKSRSYLNKTP
ncbi:DUF4175 family protein [Luteibaculum oceani]|uniref:DUF4175 family protein n=1 Tax=Luteibaculum oceani TaxID=1294296 RepID=A0A5C6VLM4_9FLAO|nr:DUF4175 family protein [Luteibaculum oceani]TXC85366.1 hypothetical protein FRX97_01705 [Luteibaculum oceani]